MHIIMYVYYNDYTIVSHTTLTYKKGMPDTDFMYDLSSIIISRFLHTFFFYPVTIQYNNYHWHNHYNFKSRSFLLPPLPLQLSTTFTTLFYKLDKKGTTKEKERLHVVSKKMKCVSDSSSSFLPPFFFIAFFPFRERILENDTKWAHSHK